MESPKAICGHLGEDEVCEVLCDDYVQATEGFCYLLAFEMTIRESIKKKLGNSPFCLQFNEKYNKTLSTNSVHVTPPSTVGGKLHIQTDSIPGQQNTVIHLGECVSCKYKFKSYSNSLRPRSLSHCPKTCSEEQLTYHELSLIRFSYFSNRVGSRSSIRNLILNEPTAVMFECREPKLYVSEAPFVDLETNVFYDGENVEIKIGSDSVVHARHSKHLKAFIHDFVASRWTNKTDDELKILGLEGPVGNLTPDFIIKETRCVLELATCGTDNQKSIENSYKDKIAKYHGELENENVKFFVIVVSPQKVYTNVTISQSMVDELSVRMRQVQPAKQKMIEVLGEDSPMMNTMS